MRKFITERALKKLKADTGGGCSVCGEVPCVNVDETYWLCGGCVMEQIEEKDKLRRIAAHVPAMTYIKAAEEAGFGVQIKPMERSQ